MSVPWDRLAGLSIASRMSQRTRAEAQQERRRREAESRRSQQLLQSTNVSTILPRADSQGIIRSSSEIQYSTRDVPTLNRDLAIRGLTGDNIRAEFAKSHANDQGTYVAIQTVDRLRVCIFATPVDGRRVHCACSEFRNLRQTRGTCAHIYWLYDRINAQRTDIAQDAILPTDLSQIEQALEPLTRRSSAQLERIIEDISPTWTDPDEEIDREVEDIMGVLDSNGDELDSVYGDEFYQDLPGSTNHNFQDLVVPGNLSRTIFGLARHDPIFRERLAAAVSREKCDKYLLRRLNKRRIAGFRELENYTQEGPSLASKFIEACAIELQEIIHQLSTYRQRVYETPNPRFDKTSAHIAIKMLRTICIWNKDIYTETSWLEEPPPSAVKDRNLYVYLNHLWNQAAPFNHGWLVNFLCHELPDRASISYIEELQDILRLLDAFKAPAGWISAIQSFVDKLQAQTSSPLGELENYQSLSDSSDSQSSQASNKSRERAGTSRTIYRPQQPSVITRPSSSATQAGPSNYPRSGIRSPPIQSPIRRPSTLEEPETQRRRLQ